MDTALITKALYTFPELIRNTHFNINLDGWPAAFTAISGFAALVSIVAITTSHQETAPIPDGAVSFLFRHKVFHEFFN